MASWYWVVGWIFSLLSLIGNGFTLFLIITRRRLFTVPNWFVLSLAVADFLFVSCYFKFQHRFSATCSSIATASSGSWWHPFSCMLPSQILFSRHDYWSVHRHCLSIEMFFLDDQQTRFGCNFMNMGIFSSPCSNSVLFRKYSIKKHALDFWNYANCGHGNNTNCSVSHFHSSHVNGKTKAPATGCHSSFSITLQ